MEDRYSQAFEVWWAAQAETNVEGKDGYTGLHDADYQKDIAWLAWKAATQLMWKKIEKAEAYEFNRSHKVAQDYANNKRV